MMEHKAFLFNNDSFEAELRPILEAALDSGDCSALVAFINARHRDLRDPYQGEPLGPDWESSVEPKDAHQYGDFALTRYYDPAADIGLGAGWDTVQEWIASDPALTESPILGHTIGPVDNPFDPGKMGSYFQSEQEVQENHRYLLNRAKEHRSEDVDRAIGMLQTALAAKTGLYVTF